MKNRLVGIIVVVVTLAGGAFLLLQPRATLESQQPSNRNTAVSQPQANHHHAAPRVPAHLETEPTLISLGQTLAPDQFTGKTKDAYRVAKKIPQTLAQLPCYCYCDQGMGHKSLHSCFEDDHASGCAVCVDEALLAYKLQTEDKLTPQQVRDAIIKKYSAEQ